MPVKNAKSWKYIIYMWHITTNTNDGVIQQRKTINSTNDSIWFAEAKWLNYDWAHINGKCKATIRQNGWNYFVHLRKSADKAEKLWKLKQNKKTIRDGTNTQSRINIRQQSN